MKGGAADCRAAPAARASTPLLFSSSPLPKEFMAVYARLRDELLTDPLLGEQPPFARSYLKEVGR